MLPSEAQALYAVHVLYICSACSRLLCSWFSCQTIYIFKPLHFQVQEKRGLPAFPQKKTIVSAPKLLVDIVTKTGQVCILGPTSEQTVVALSPDPKIYKACVWFKLDLKTRLWLDVWTVSVAIIWSEVFSRISLGNSGQKSNVTEEKHKWIDPLISTPLHRLANENLRCETFPAWNLMPVIFEGRNSPVCLTAFYASPQSKHDISVSLMVVTPFSGVSDRLSC